MIAGYLKLCRPNVHRIFSILIDFIYFKALHLFYEDRFGTRMPHLKYNFKYWRHQFPSLSISFHLKYYKQTGLII